MTLSHTERVERYVDKAVICIVDELASAQVDRNAALNKAAFALGGFIGAGELSEEEAIKQLVGACETNGYLRKDGRAQVSATIKSGLRKGMQNPRELPREDFGAQADRAKRKLQAPNDEQANPGPRQVRAGPATLASYATERKQHHDALAFMGFHDSRHGLGISYVQRDGSKARTQYRGPTWIKARFGWAPDEKDLPIVAFEPDRGELARKTGELLICEGAGDTATAFLAGLAAVGIPGADQVKATLCAHHFDGVARVFVCVDTNEVGDPDAGGVKFRKSVPRQLDDLGFTGEVFELRMPDRAKDMSELWVRDPEAFMAKMAEAKRAASEPPKPAYLTLQEMAATCLKPVGKRLATGFATLDGATRGGVPLGRLIMALGAPGAGKTTLFVQLTDTFEQQGCAVLYLAADEPAEGIVTRFGQLAGFSRDALESEGDIGEAVRSGFAKRVEGRALSVVDPDANERMRFIEDAASALDHLAQGRPRVLIVDSLQTAACAAAEGLESQRERIDAKLAVLKAIAKRGVLVIAISEMARSAYRSGDRNQDTSALSAGKESGSIEYGAALLLGLRSVKGETGLVDVEVAKNRLGGSKPEFRLRLDADRASFAEVAKPDPEEQREQVEDAKEAKARALVIEAVRTNRSLKSKNDVVTATNGGNRTAYWKAATALMLEGVLVKVDGMFRLQLGEENG